MRYGIVSGYGYSLSVSARLQDEGHETLTWMDHEAQNIQGVGDGIVPKETNYDRFVEWCRAQPDTIVIFDASGMGERADDLRAKGLVVLGGGAFMDKLEKDRRFGMDLAARAGFNLPPYEEFETLSACTSWAQNLGDQACYYKSDKYLDKDLSTYSACDGDDLAEHLIHVRTKTGDRNRCIVQRKIEGVALSTARWWNGRAFVGPYETTIEHQPFMDGDVGPGTSCSLNAVWFSDTSPIAAQWDAFDALFREHDAPVGLYDVNCIVDEDGRFWFLEWTPRFGYDSEPTGFRLFENLGALFEAMALGRGDARVSSEIAYSLRLTVPPYPWEYSEAADKHTCIGIPVRGVTGLWDDWFIAYQVAEDPGGLYVASSEGIVGLALATGQKLSVLAEEALEGAERIRCRGLQYRTDGAKVIKKDAEALKAAGLDVHPGLLE